MRHRRPARRSSRPTTATATSCTAATAKQWYVEADYSLGNTLVGVSAGQGKQDADVTAGFNDGQDDPGHGLLASKNSPSS